MHGRILVKNTVFMYIRMLFLLVIYFYTSRILLKNLGENDFGIYSLVGSVIAMFESIKILFTSSTQRFLNYVMGLKDKEKLSAVFNTSLAINLIIAVIFLICVEFAGLWFLNFKANISPDRILAAKIIFQCSLSATIISILTTPYDAILIAREKMDVYAVISLIDGVLKLLIVLSLVFFTFDKLVIYGVLILVVTLIIRLITVIYCNKNFKECKIKFTYDKPLFKQMAVFAGWQFLGNASATVTQNGLNLILNVFGGTVLNAARGIAYQVRSAVNMFLNNITVVVNPYITKLCAERNNGKMFATMFLSSKVTFMLDSVIVIPILFLTDGIVRFWLGYVPGYSVVFIKILVANTLVSALRQQLDIIFKALGKLKYYQIIDSFFTILPLFISYIFLKHSQQYELVFFFVLAADLSGFFACVLLATKTAELNLKKYLQSTVLPCGISAILIYLLYLINTHFFSAHFALSLGFTILAIIVCLSYLFFLGFDKMEKNQVKQVIVSYLPKRK